MKTKLNWIFENYNTRGLTEEQMKDLVAEHWNNMAENNYDMKDNSSLVFANPYEVLYDCFACEYYKMDCWLCPFSKYMSRKNPPCVEGYKSPYKEWIWEKSKESCIEIAELFMD